MEKNQIKISNASSSGSFASLIESEHPLTILFSAPFGMGKTYFLKEFFKENSEKYYCVHLHPTNYQIADNEKILDFIKVDILTSIFESKNPSKTLDKSLSDIGNLNRFKDIVFSIGKSFLKVDFQEIMGIVNDPKYITEDDIVNALKKVVDEKNIHKKDNKKENGKKKTTKGKSKVLIIDDLDRVDPEHVFRLFNVFSTFVGEDEGETKIKKLGFDVVIFVCDVNNIKKIFHHKYGEGVNFDGYINKAIKEIYNYSLEDELFKVLKEQPQFSDPQYPQYEEMVCFLIKLLAYASKRGLINLRSILKLMDGSISYSNEKLSPEKASFICLFYYFVHLCGSRDTAIEILLLYKRNIEENELKYQKEVNENTLFYFEIAYIYYVLIEVKEQIQSRSFVFPDGRIDELKEMARDAKLLLVLDFMIKYLKNNYNERQGFEIAILHPWGDFSLSFEGVLEYGK